MRGWIIGALAWAGLLGGAASTAGAAPQPAGAPRAAAPRPAATLAVSTGTATPEQSLPLQVTLSGAASGASVLHALVRPAADAGCGTSFEADRTAHPTASVVLADGVAEPSGAYATTVGWTPEATGGYLVCAWLHGQAGTTAASAPVTVRGPQVPVLSLAFSTAPIAATPFTIEYTVQTDQPLRLLSTIRPAGAAPSCGPSQSADVQAHPGERVLFPGGVPVAGGPATTPIAVRDPVGAYLICTWVAGPALGEVDAALASPFTIAPQQFARPPRPAQLRVTGLRAAVGARVRVRGTSALGVAGTLALTAACGARRTHGTATVLGGRFRGSLALPRRCRAHRWITVTAAWAGSSMYRPGTAVGKAIVSGRRRRLPLLFGRIARTGHRFRDVFGVRPRRITVGTAALVVRWSSWSARSGRGAGVARPGHRRYRVTVHAFHPVRGRFACLTVTRRSGAHRRAGRYGLGRLGGTTFAWLPVRWLHRRASGATPWPRPGCPD